MPGPPLPAAAAPKIAAACKAILKEEKAMAKVLEGQLAAINATYLDTLDAEAKEVPAKKAPAKAKAKR